MALLLPSPHILLALKLIFCVRKSILIAFKGSFKETNVVGYFKLLHPETGRSKIPLNYTVLKQSVLKATESSPGEMGWNCDCLKDKPQFMWELVRADATSRSDGRSDYLMAMVSFSLLVCELSELTTLMGLEMHLNNSQHGGLVCERKSSHWNSWRLFVHKASHLPT